MAIMPICRDGAWVALHDIRLDTLHGGAFKNNSGPKYLLEAWPWAKRADDNIGAIRLEGTLDDMRALCHKVLGTAWQTTVPRATLLTLGEEHGELVAEHESLSFREALAALESVARARPLVVWGAGQGGRELVGRLSTEGVAVSFAVDSDIRKHGQSIDGVTICGAEALRTGDVRPFVAISSVFATQIASHLERQGLKVGADFMSVRL